MKPHNRHHVSRGPSISGRPLRHVTAFCIALVTLMSATLASAPVVAQEQSEAETQTGETLDQGAAAIEVHVSSCDTDYAGSNIFDDCHGNGLAGVNVILTSADDTTDQAKTTEQVQSPGPGVVQFGNLSAGNYTIALDVPDQNQRFVTYCSLADSDQVVPMSPGNERQGQVEVAADQTVICDFYVIPGGASDGDPESRDQAQITINPVTCPQETDPQSGIDALVDTCSEPVDNVTFTLGDASGAIETINTNASDNGQIVIDGIEPGTYSLYSDVPLEFASETLFCLADDGNRYQKEFNEDGVTTFTDVKREQIVCDWFIIPSDLQGEPDATATSDSAETPSQVATQDPVVTPTPVSTNGQDALQSAAETATPPPTGGEQDDAQTVRGVETGGSLVVHLALCPPGYDGDAVFDACHGSGISDQPFTLSGPDGSLDQTTVVPQTPGPGIVEFTGLSAGSYELAGGPPGDFGRVELYCSLQPDGAQVETSLQSTVATFSIGEGDDVLCDWYYIPENATDETPTPTAEPVERAEILTTLFACEPGATLTGASYADFVAACDETRDGVEFALGDVGAPPLIADNGVSGPGAVRFYDLLPADYTLTPRLPDDLSSAAIFCQIDGGDWYQKTITNGATTFVDVDGEAINCSWFAAQAVSQPQPAAPQGPSGSITVREFLCGEDQSKITDWERQCVAGTSGSTFTLASIDGAISREMKSADNGVMTFGDLPDGFYTLEQQEGMWCKARAERVDSQSRLIVEDGQNTDVFLYHCSAVTTLPSTGAGPTISLIDDERWAVPMMSIQLGLMSAGVAGLMILIVLNMRRRWSRY